MTSRRVCLCALVSAFANAQDLFLARTLSSQETVQQSNCLNRLGSTECQGFDSYPHYKCYDESQPEGSISTSVDDCAAQTKFRGKGCFVYEFSAGTCFIREHCPNYASGCQYGRSGTESWKFTTYIVSPSFPEVQGFDAHRHYNCYDGHGAPGSQYETPIVSSVEACAEEVKFRGKGCFVYLFSQGTCHPREFCEDPPSSCEYGEPGTESWEFTTFISS